MVENAARNSAALTATTVRRMRRISLRRASRRAWASARGSSWSVWGEEVIVGFLGRWERAITTSFADHPDAGASEAWEAPELRIELAGGRRVGDGDRHRRARAGGREQELVGPGGDDDGDVVHAEDLGGDDLA